MLTPREIEAVYLIPPELKLEWTPKFDFFTTYAANGAISIVVKKSQEQSHWDMWEIIVGVWYYSRDRVKYFNSPGSAMLQAELVVKAVAKKLMEVL